MSAAPDQPRPCDLCGAARAPFGYTLPGGRAAQKKGQRPLWSCLACRPVAEDRRATALERFGPSRFAPGGTHDPRKKSPHPSLFD